VRAVRRSLLLFLLIGCGEPARGGLAIAPGPFGQVAELVALTPGTELADAGDITVVDDAALSLEAFQLERSGDGVVVHAHDALGAQYGVAAALEAYGYRFRHPHDPLVPDAPVLGEVDPAVHAPETRVRGLQLHTLHPIEGYYATWEPDGGDDARAIVDWLIKNRGNYLQWVALDDIMDPARHAEWQQSTRALIDYAHARGVRVGLNLQLFGQSNLQNAFDLDDTSLAQVHERLPLVTQDLPFDSYALSFGEFFDADPQVFIDSVDAVRDELRADAPAAEMHAVVHVGDTQRVTYMGQDTLYYFLVQYADPSIIPDIHTVMFYDLFEPAGGAYHHADFAEHRAYLRSRMCAGQPVAYFPETAYWIAFDDSVPQAEPLYVRNRWLDLDRLRASGCGPLDTHLLFSSGWEWGYWLHDTTALRASYELPPSWQALIDRELAPDLAGAAPVVEQLVELQHTALMDAGLAPYVAGRDAAIDAGRLLGIVSQPDRVTFDDLATLADWSAFRAQVLAPLAAYARALDALAVDVPDTRWGRELADGIAVDRLRAHFVGAAYEAQLAQLAGDRAGAAAQLAIAHRLLAEAQAIVRGRHADLHDPHGRRLVEQHAPNHTFYAFGYLAMADTLCYWARELAQVEGETPASCLF
jgi:hypothetical protein